MNETTTKPAQGEELFSAHIDQSMLLVNDTEWPKLHVLRHAELFVFVIPALSECSSPSASPEGHANYEQRFVLLSLSSAVIY